jgi:RHS repeat-associated protein
MSQLRSIGRAIGQFFRMLLFIGAIVATPIAAQVPVQQMPANGRPMWNGPERDQWFDTPEEACRAWHASYNPNAIYQQGEYTQPTYYGCKWILDDDSNSVLPNGIFMVCSGGLPANAQGTCTRTRDREPPCDCSDGGGPANDVIQPLVGNPVALNYATKMEHEVDYSSGDGRFLIERDYRSRPRAFQYPAATTEIAGFGDQWHGLVPGRLTYFGHWGHYIEYLSPQGTTSTFIVDGDYYDGNNWTYRRAQASNRRRLSMVTTPQVSRDTFFRVQSAVPNGPPEMRMDMPNGEYILFRRANHYLAGDQIRYLVPVEKGYPDGYKIYYDYPDAGEFPNVVRDSFGRQMMLSWNEVKQTVAVIGEAPIIGRPVQKVISQIILPDATKLVYSYGYAKNMAGIPVKNRLDRVERQSAAGAVLWARDYLHENADYQWAITGKRDQNGNRLATYSYDVAGLVSSTERAGGVDRYTIQNFENPGDPSTTYRYRYVTNPLGRRTDYVFLGRLNNPNTPQLLESVTGYATPNLPADSRSYNFHGYIGDYSPAWIVDEKGRTQTFSIDAGLRPISTTEANGTADARQTTMQWHSVLDLPTQEERPGLRINYTYSPEGRLLTRTETDTTTHTMPYATAGQARTWTYTWNGAGRLDAINGPKAVSAGKDDTLTFSYHAANGNLLTSTNGLGHVTSYGAYDANGRPGTMTDPNGIVTAFAYDELGRTTTINVKHPTDAAHDAITTLEYDVEGRVIGITRPATDKLIIDYNLAGQMTTIRAASGERIDYVNNAMGGVTSETVKRSNGTIARQVTRTFDELNRVLTETLGPSRTRSFAYDKMGNVTQVTSPRNHATQHAFDALDRLVQTVAPDTGVTAASYNVWDQPVSHTDAATVQTTMVRNGFGEVIQEVSPDRGTSVYYYNTGGELTAAIDGRGQRVDYTRDILGRITGKTPVGRPASEAITFTWDTAGLGSYKIGRLMSVADGSGTTQFQYDHRGNLLVKRQTVGSTASADLAYTYDLADRITQVTYPSGRIVDYVRDTKGRVSTVRTKASAGVPAWTELMTSMEYEPFGSLKQGIYGNTLSFTADWGNDGRLASRRVYKTSGGANISMLSYSYDAADNMTGIADAVTPSASTTFAYDPVERLTRIEGSLSGGHGREDHLHDKNGNRLAVERRTNAADATPAQTDSYTTTPGTNRLASIAGTAGTRSLAYDARGNLSGETRPGGSSVTASYDGHARLTGYSQDAIVLTHTYNGLDDRVATTEGTTTTRFVYDPAGRIVGEYGASASDVRAEHIWLSPEEEHGAFGGDDGTGGYTPLAVAQTPSGGTATLSWVHANHLGHPLLTTNATGTAITLADYTPLGFPGQVKTLPHLWYNRHRDYDPTTGRYIQADPIGLAGDANPYGYAKANPLKYIDPEGLNAAIAVRGAVAVGDLAGAGLWLWCQRSPALCMRTIGRAAVWVANLCEGENDEEREARCERNLERDLSTCRAMGKRNGKAAYEICRRQAMLRYGNCLSGRDKGINAPLPPWGTK